MAIYRYGTRTPQVAPQAYVSESAQVIGDVIIGPECYIGHGAILRGDYGSIRLGPGTAVEENAVIHIAPDWVITIGERVTIGHAAVLHCDRVGDFAVIGMGAVISYGVSIGRWAIIGEGCLVPNGMQIPDEKLALGVPARIAGDVHAKAKAFWEHGKQVYVDLARDYPSKLVRVD